MTEFNIEAITRIRGIPNEPALPEQFQVRVMVTVRTTDNSGANTAVFVVNLPFDEGATYAAIEAAAIDAVQKSADSIRGCPQTHSAEQGEQSDCG